MLVGSPSILASTLCYPAIGGGDDRKRQITIRHVLTMTSGLEPDDRPTASGYRGIMFDQPTVAGTGKRWAYASLPVDLLGAALQGLTGKTVKQLFDERVARKIGIPDVTWTKNPTPYTRASSGATMSARSLARVGQMLLNRGTLGSRRVMATTQHSALISYASHLDTVHFQTTPDSPFRIPQNNSAPRSYLRLLWSNRAGILGPRVPRNVYLAWGLNEQFLAIFPTEQLVVVRLGAGPRSDPNFRIEFFKRIVDAL
jgi:CubicO group peptidase (beta-lactamase class C family)